MAAYGTGVDNWSYENENNPLLTANYPQAAESSAQQESNNSSKMNGTAQKVGAEESQEHKQRLKELVQKEQEVIVLEQALDARDELLRQTLRSTPPKKNWPYPAIGWARNAISRDIPVRYQGHVRKFYALWLLTALATSLNLILCFWYGLSKKGSDEVGVVQWILAVCYVFLGN
ncbi:hypothetical protein RFI_23158 [Reticulomyxa filosa]|uniref:Secretory carrier membrane protein n=1 Tax=Reticulomyxa filosa TaxID=46433 RepID=X6MK13_RETFI|nr:hypothetical protein RFI_23158 [Reticulomyxa filosa]|eukprot:ETO14209.1 hypothetical protein RFI_23158 [Reticulomyxa filosa]